MKERKKNKKGSKILCCSISGYVSPHHCRRIQGWLDPEQTSFSFSNRKEKEKGGKVGLDNKEAIDKGE